MKRRGNSYLHQHVNEDGSGERIQVVEAEVLPELPGVENYAHRVVLYSHVGEIRHAVPQKNRLSGQGKTISHGLLDAALGTDEYPSFHRLVDVENGVGAHLHFLSVKRSENEVPHRRWNRRRDEEED